MTQKTKAKHTEEPWKAVKYTTRFRIFAGDHLIAVLEPGEPEDRALLLAQAPDLLRQRDEALDALEDVSSYFGALQEMQPKAEHGIKGDEIRERVRAILECAGQTG